MYILLIVYRFYGLIKRIKEDLELGCDIVVMGIWEELDLRYVG